jgi:hypothetical protein
MADSVRVFEGGRIRPSGAIFYSSGWDLAILNMAFNSRLIIQV